MPWEEVVTAAVAILDLQHEREKAGADEAGADAILLRARDVLTDINTQAVAPLVALGRQELAADIAAKLDTFSAYAVSPSGAQSRLVNLIDDTRSTIEELRQILVTGPNEQPVLETFAPYALVVAMQALAVTDKKYRFAPEPFGSLIENALAHAGRIRDILRRRSDLRFHFAARNEEPGFISIGYTFEGQFHLEAIVPSRGNSSVARNNALAKMASESDRLFPTFPRVRETQAFTLRLLDVAAFELVVLALTERVSPFEQVQVDAGSTPQRFAFLQ